jgi:hypothetical protein
MIRLSAHAAKIPRAGPRAKRRERRGNGAGTDASRRRHGGTTAAA